MRRGGGGLTNAANSEAGLSRTTVRRALAQKRAHPVGPDERGIAEVGRGDAGGPSMARHPMEHDTARAKAKGPHKPPPLKKPKPRRSGSSLMLVRPIRTQPVGRGETQRESTGFPWVVGGGRIAGGGGERGGRRAPASHRKSHDFRYGRRSLPTASGSSGKKIPPHRGRKFGLRWLDTALAGRGVRARLSRVPFAGPTPSA